MDIRAYTGNQILIGTFVGGPLAAIYYLKKNFDAMGRVDYARKTIQYGALIIVIMLALVPFLPTFIPGVAYAIAYAAAAKAIYEQHHKIALKDGPRYSHWNVAGVAILSIIAFVIILIPVVFIFDALGVLPMEEASSV